MPVDRAELGRGVLERVDQDKVSVRCRLDVVAVAVGTG